MAVYSGTPPGWHAPMVLPRPAQPALTNPTSYDRLEQMRLNRDRYVVDPQDRLEQLRLNREKYVPTMGWPLQTGADSPAGQAMHAAVSSGGGGGGGGGGMPVPLPPGDLQAVKVRSTPGYRTDLYTESERPYIQGFSPRFIVLGNQQAW